jgi:ankyrin repeat protein
VWIIAFLWLVLAMRALNRRVMSMVVDRATLRLTTMRRSWIIPLSSIRETCLVVIGLERLHVAVKDASERTFILPFPEQAVDVMQEIQRARAATPANGVRVMSAHVDPRGRRSLMSALSIAAVLIALVVPVYTGLALGEAARFGKRSAVHMLLDVGAPIDGRGSSGRPPLYQAAKFGREHIVLDLIARGADPVAPERKYGFTSLHMAAQENRPRIAEILLAHGVPVDVRNARGRTPLLHAASHGIADNVELAALLLNAGARIDAADNEGFTAVHIAAQEENLHFLRYIVSKGAAIDQLNGGFGTALSAASRRGRPDLVRELQALGADINTIVYSSRSPLGIAVGDGDLHMVEALMSLGARTDVQGRDSYTPLHFAVYIGRHDMVHSMLAAGARPNLNVPRMPPPLMMAVRQADTTMIRILLDAGASPGYMWNGRTPLQLAMQLGDSHVIAMLRRRTSR